MDGEHAGLACTGRSSVCRACSSSVERASAAAATTWEAGTAPDLAHALVQQSVHHRGLRLQQKEAARKEGCPCNQSDTRVTDYHPTPPRAVAPAGRSCEEGGRLAQLKSGRTVKSGVLRQLRACSNAARHSSSAVLQRLAAAALSAASPASTPCSFQHRCQQTSQPFSDKSTGAISLTLPRRAL